MEAQIDHILVFATNIKTGTDKQMISEVLDKNQQILQWSLDQEDVDCVLRIVSETLSEEEIIKLLDKQNFECTALE
ncbi:hypothetical protein [Flavobacterium gilvum]|uniref:Uncharacterized protein n=1 Tax=Flavobacterium gilvum TaxID=1492737 RepID=A0AAC9I801_9FLAO|nr:hypothetical protein [Flavobacterium gilvum]AOW09677.1 hypothetical protein EM308_09260 [Flavobacterium gilvum]KFC60792.1 hypothetical protein FEM08_04340 [Flavobacterium gilvum]